MTRDDIVTRYRWQFRHGREIDASVPDAWLPAVDELCAAIEAAVPPLERAGFYWLDGKEKRGALSVDYVVPAGVVDAVEALAEQVIERVERIDTQIRHITEMQKPVR
jgi:hypothetical protein